MGQLHKVNQKMKTETFTQTKSSASTHINISEIPLGFHSQRPVRHNVCWTCEQYNPPISIVVFVVVSRKRTEWTTAEQTCANRERAKHRKYILRHEMADEYTIYIVHHDGLMRRLSRQKETARELWQNVSRPASSNRRYVSCFCVVLFEDDPEELLCLYTNRTALPICRFGPSVRGVRRWPKTTWISLCLRAIHCIWHLLEVRVILFCSTTHKHTCCSW